ncbi:MAG: hypothetical protein LBB73_04030 [Dysgonamonadaceae bacterium]|jgi:hypothetical protein|nr:hypothetical protein [Dysgonamonadaceae bacterium]
MEELKYFKLAKQLNERFREELLKKEAHFRGNIKSCSLISLNRETPAIGISDILTETAAESKLSEFEPQKPGLKIPKKYLQSWIILHAIKHNHILPFGDNLNLTFITSELAIVLRGNKRVNDILAINENEDLVVIKLLCQENKKEQAKEQALEFKKIIEDEDEKDFFKELTKLMTGRSWSGNVKCVIVWTKDAQNPRREEIEVYQL